MGEQRRNKSADAVRADVRATYLPVECGSCLFYSFCPCADFAVGVSKNLIYI
jgi:hypothetical protein